MYSHSSKRTSVDGTYVDEPIVLTDPRGVAEQLDDYHANSLHSVAAMTDSTRVVTERSAYFVAL